MQLTEHFTLEEFTRSETAIRKGIDNTPDQQVIDNLKALCVHVLEPLRSKLGKEISITSGYRSAKVNKAIGGAGKSQHIEGKAADIHIKGVSIEELYQYMRTHSEFDQCIQEFGQWVHVSWNGFNNRNMNLRAVKQDGKTVYIAD